MNPQEFYNKKKEYSQEKLSGLKRNSRLMDLVETIFPEPEEEGLYRRHLRRCGD